VLNIRCLSDAQRLLVVDDKGKILYATSPLAALLSTKVLALVGGQMQALLPPPAAQLHKLWMKVRHAQVLQEREICVLGMI
jgi:nitrogen-specific signal transduction histidine kinase